MLLSVVSLMILFGSLEAILRANGLSQVHAQYFDTDLGGTRFRGEETVTMMARGGQQVGEASINGQGYRGPWFEGPKTPGVVRIAAIGDSVTFGWSVANDETYPAQISKLLDLAGTPHEIVNFGIPGYNTANELALYEQVVRPHQPDVVIVCVTPNDIEPTIPPPSYRGGPLGKWFEGTGLYGALHGVLDLNRVLVQAPTDPGYKQRSATWAEHGLEIRVDPRGVHGWPLLQTWQADMDALLTAITGDGCKVLVVTIPCKPVYREVRWSRYRGDNPLQLPAEMMGWQREIASACERAKAIHLDLLLPFVETPHIYGKIDKGHPSPQGQRVIASQATEKLVSLGWVQAAR